MVAIGFNERISGRPGILNLTTMRGVYAKEFDDGDSVIIAYPERAATIAHGLDPDVADMVILLLKDAIRREKPLVEADDLVVMATQMTALQTRDHLSLALAGGRT